MVNYTFSCINENRTLLSGEIIKTMPQGGKIWTQEIDREKLREKSDLLWDAYETTGSLENLSDYAVTLIYLGEYQRAKNIYLQIEKESPDLYTTASNIGTIYELIGYPDSALVWIKKSMELNSNSHNGSEWIHVKILEFKLRKEKEYGQSILELDFGSEDKPANPHNHDLEEISEHISHQLRERLNFVKPQNKIVGNIYFDYGNVLAQTSTVEAALESYEAAKEYGFISNLLDKRISALKAIAAPNRLREGFVDFVKENYKLLGLAFLSVMLLAFVLFIWFVIKLIKHKGKEALEEGI